jgi:uncharacterized protein
MQIRPAIQADFQSVLALNLESERFMSPLSFSRLELLAEQAHVHWVVEDNSSILAFLLAFREGSAYDSINYKWFSTRYQRFLYVDRIAVSLDAQGRGLGTLLYKSVFAQARSTAVQYVACEYDVDPPNPVSANFHARFGFAEVGQQFVASANKAVSMQLASVKVSNEA